MTQQITMPPVGFTDPELAREYNDVWEAILHLQAADQRDTPEYRDLLRRRAELEALMRSDGPVM